MSQFETAHRHLTRAMKRLEAAVELRKSEPADGSAGGGPGSGALARISAERDELARNLGVLRAEASRTELREVSGHVAQRLDGSIVELDRLLGS